MSSPAAAPPMDPLPSHAGMVERPHGIRVAYAAVGAADAEAAASAAKRMVVSHNMGATALQQREPYRSLVDDGWTIVTYDQRGHGAASAPTDPARFDPREMGGDLQAILDDLQWPSAWLVGISLGCVPSLAAAVAAPARADGVVLICPAHGAEPNAEAAEFAAIGRAFRTSQDAGLDAYRAWAARFSVPEPALTDHVQSFAVHDPASVGVWMEVFGGWTISDELDALRSFPHPVIVIPWPDDPVHPWAVGEDIARRAPHGHLVTLAQGRLAAGPWSVFDVVVTEIEALTDHERTRSVRGDADTGGS